MSKHVKGRFERSYPRSYLMRMSIPVCEYLMDSTESASGDPWPGGTMLIACFAMPKTVIAMQPAGVKSARSSGRAIAGGPLGCETFETERYSAFPCGANGRLLFEGADCDG